LIIDSIHPKKDADGLTAINVKRWLGGTDSLANSSVKRAESHFIFPATARGIRELLTHYKIGLAGKRVTVVGRSMLVGKPIAAMCLNENATVTVCHSQTPNLAEETKKADILIVAAGKSRLIQEKHVREGQVIIDVGINSVEGEKGINPRLAGDVDFNKVKDIVSAITPVPGGVGPMTVFGLFENLVELSE
jgi:methylenetetrahydrofolate dehydrogenase (NADP+) / methenyltetrahydrofolate cyclohydrolase